MLLCISNKAPEGFMATVMHPLSRSNLCLKSEAHLRSEVSLQQVNIKGMETLLGNTLHRLAAGSML